MADADDYLQEGFDPRSVTVPRLRSILVTHNVDYPSTAKKPQLVQLVADHVLPHTARFRAQRARAKRSSMGIVNAGSAEDNNLWDDGDLLPTPHRARRSGSPRKSSARIVAPDAEPVATDAGQRFSRSVSRQFPSDSDEARQVPKSAHRNLRSATPRINVESDDDESSIADSDHLSREDESVFTDDNPFQSGPTPVARTLNANRRRTGTLETIRPTSYSARRQEPARDRGLASSTLETPVFRPRSSSPVDSLEPGEEFTSSLDSLEPGEEFTPDQQLELERAARAGEISVTPRKAASEQSRQPNFKPPLLVLLMAFLFAYGAWYRQAKMSVGYCGLGRPAKSLLPPDYPVPEFALPWVEPQCEPCPSHAFCFEDFSVSCEQDFILKQHPLSLGGIIPVPPSCEPDGEKARRVQAVANKAVEELRERRAKFECGSLVDKNGQQPSSAAVSEEELKETVSRMRNKRLSSKDFDDLWAAAIGEVKSREEVVIEAETPETADSSGLSTRLSSASLARLPLSCIIKRSIWLGLARCRVPIGFLVLVVFAVWYLRTCYRRHMTTSAQVPAIVDAVLDRLANQKQLGQKDLDDPWLFLPNLRDDILRSVHALSERERIWKRVRAIVQQNSNVRTGQREGRSGEVGRAWEWIGPLQGDGTRRRRSGRSSWTSDTHTDTPETRVLPDVTRWEESRPIY